jgi:hypothetical protein
MKKYEVKSTPETKVEEEVTQYSTPTISYGNFSLDQLKYLKEELDLYIELKEAEEDMDKGNFYTEEEFKQRLDEHILVIEKNMKKSEH